MLARSLEVVDATHVRVGGRTLIYFAGCDYHRLAGHPQVLAAVRRALVTEGLNVAASRLTTGNHGIYARLERGLAEFFKAPVAVVFSTGYGTNQAVAQALAGEFTHAFVDERAHSSLVDAVRFLGCRVVRFAHRDPDSLGAGLRRAGAGCVPLVMTDGVCAHDGGVAPLRAYRRLLPAAGWLLVDDSHGLAVVGTRGGGAVEWEGVSRQRLIQTGALSKGLGVYGGVVLAPVGVAARIASRSGLFVGNTPLPPMLAAGVLASMRVLRRDGARRRRLQENAAHVKGILRSVGLEVPDTPAPIVALPPCGEEGTARLRTALLRAGIFPSHTRYPGGPVGGYYRFVISSEHTRAQLDCLLGVLVPQVREWRAAGGQRRAAGGQRRAGGGERRAGGGGRGFTLIELLVVVAVVAVLAGLLLPALARSKASAGRIRCVGSLHQMGLAAQMYWDDNAGQSFRYRGISTNGGDVYWFGWINRGAEGDRVFDPKPGVLHPYLRGRGIEACPALRPSAPGFKAKAREVIHGFGYNLSLSASVGQPAFDVGRLARPGGLGVFADAAQVNTFQAPASVDNPMLEEFFYVTTNEPTAHFRHGRLANVVFGDGHVGREAPAAGSLDGRLPKAWVGRLRGEVLVAP